MEVMDIICFPVFNALHIWNASVPSFPTIMCAQFLYLIRLSQELLIILLL